MGSEAPIHSLHFGDPIDYDGRLEHLNILVSQVDNQSQTADFNDQILYWKAVIVNCMFMYQTISDLSVQTICSRLLGQIMKKTRHKSPAYDVLVAQNIIPAVRKMLKSKDEKHRFEFIQILGDIVRIYPEDPELGQLSCLRDETNIDIDFFSNSTHLQLHKRQRAYNRASTQIRDGNIQAKVAEKFIFPIAICTLMDVTLIRQTGLLNAALDLVATVAERMSWSNFRKFFELQLGLAMRGGAKVSEKSGQKFRDLSRKDLDREERQKMTIKIVCRLVQCIHWPIENVTNEFKLKITRISNLNYSDQSTMKNFDIVESRNHLN